MKYITENFIKQNGINSLSIQNWLSYIPGIFCIGVLGNNIVNTIIAQKILLYEKKIDDILVNIEEYKIPDYMLVLLTISCIGSFFLHDNLEIISKTLLFIFLFPYIIFSIATLNLITKYNNRKYLILFIIYTFIVLLIWPLLIMVVISIFEPWINLRKWIHKKTKG